MSCTICAATDFQFFSANFIFRQASRFWAIFVTFKQQCQYVVKFAAPSLVCDERTLTIFLLLISAEFNGEDGGLETRDDEGERSQCQPIWWDSSGTHVSVGGCGCALVYVYLHRTSGGSRRRLADDGRVGCLACQCPTTTRHHRWTMSSAHTDARCQCLLRHTYRHCMIALHLCVLTLNF